MTETLEVEYDEHRKVKYPFEMARGTGATPIRSQLHKSGE